MASQSAKLIFQRISNCTLGLGPKEGRKSCAQLNECYFENTVYVFNKHPNEGPDGEISLYCTTKDGLLSCIIYYYYHYLDLATTH